MERKLRVPEAIVTLLRGAHPEIRRKIKASIRSIIENPGQGKALKDELEGLRSFPVGRFRIVYRESGEECIDIVAIGPRSVIYEETYRIIKRSKSHQE
nr:type II toxin-antitoxin system RelE/ParE family toxin [Deltaproteobacteria bacterium]